MAGQAPSRRQLLQALACASLASGAPGFVRWSFAFAEPAPPGQQPAHHHAPTSSPAHHAQPYTPQFFTPAEYASIVTLAELILPRTPSPQPTTPHAAARPHPVITSAEAGATDAGVAEFIDFMVVHDPTLQAVFRPGLAWFDIAASPQIFVALTPAQQNALLERVAYKRNFRPDEKPGQEFFSVMRRYTVMGFYTTRLGLEALDYPGLRFYAESPSVPASDLKDGALAQLGADA